MPLLSGFVILSMIMDNAISEIDYDDPMLFFEIANTLGKVIAKNKG